MVLRGKDTNRIAVRGSNGNFRLMCIEKTCECGQDDADGQHELEKTCATTTSRQRSAIQLEKERHCNSYHPSANSLQQPPNEETHKVLR